MKNKKIPHYRKSSNIRYRGVAAYTLSRHGVHIGSLKIIGK